MSKALQKRENKLKHKVSTLVISKSLQKRENKSKHKKSTLVMSKVPPARSFYYPLLVFLRLPPCLSPCKAAKKKTISLAIYC